MRPKQESARLRKRVEVRFGVGDPQFVGFTGNLSTAGMMLRTTRVYPPGTVLTLELAYAEKRFRLDAAVIWARSGSVQWLHSGRIGMGLLFVNPPSGLLEALRSQRPNATPGDTRTNC